MRSYIKPSAVLDPLGGNGSRLHPNVLVEMLGIAISHCNLLGGLFDQSLLSWAFPAIIVSSGQVREDLWCMNRADGRQRR